MNAECLHLLIVEDETAHVEAIRRAFEKADANVEIRAVGTLRDFRAAVADRLPDVALVDLNLPDGKGMEIMTVASDTLPFPILIMTAFGSQEMVVEVMKAGAVDYVVKSPEAFAAMPQTMDRAFRDWRLIQKHKKAKDMLRASEIRYRRLFEAARDGILILNAETGMVVDVNPFMVKLLGVPREVFLGKKVWELGFFKDIFANEAKFIELQQKGYIRYDDMAMEGHDGRRHEVEFVSNVYLVNNEKVIQCNIRDISERMQAQMEVKKLNAELEKRVRDRTVQLDAANKELEAFSYSVSHDLRTPLRHVQGYVDMLAREAQGPFSEKGRHYMKTITEVTRGMGELIDDLLAFSRMGRAEMIETRVDLNAMVQDARRYVEPTSPKRNIIWTIPPLPAVQGDPAMLKLVLGNLLANAVKFTLPRDPAMIEMGTTGTENGRVILFVRDNGVGFDQQYSHKLFGVFQRLHRADEFEGTGIGLANVRRIIARHGGRTWAEGELEKGATFYFTLKASAE